MRDWMKTASATFAGGAVAIGLVAIPTYVWLPREFDDIRDQTELAVSEAAQAREASIQSRDIGAEVSDKIDTLIIAIASMDAEPVSSTSIALSANGLTFRGGSGAVSSQFAQLLPQDILVEIVDDGKISKFRYSSFNGQDWVFIDRASFSEFSFERQQAIETSFQRSNVSFVID